MRKSRLSILLVMLTFGIAAHLQAADLTVWLTDRAENIATFNIAQGSKLKLSADQLSTDKSTGIQIASGNVNLEILFDEKAVALTGEKVVIQPKLLQPRPTIQ